MNRVKGAVGGVFLCFALLISVPGRATSSMPITLEFQNAPLTLILQALADHQQMNLVTAPSVQGNLSVRLSDVPWQQALDIILQMGNVTSHRQGNVLMISPAADPAQIRLKKEQESQDELRQRPLTSMTLALHNADATETAASLDGQKGSLLTERGLASADIRTNTILVRDTQQALDAVAPWVKEMDLPLQQVQLAAHIVTMNSESLRELGVRWGFSGDHAVTKSVRMNNFTMGLPVDNPAFTAGFNLAHISGRILDLELTALEQENQVDIIASPRLLTAHMQTASIKQGSEIPYQVSSGGRGRTSIEFKEAVLGMEVTPKIQRNGNITLTLHISQNMPGKTVKQAEGEALAIDKQEIKTQVTVKDGETVVLGGIFQRHHQNTQSKVPLLGDIPLVGSLFKHQAKNQKRRELVIFITPTLINSQ
jgi:protein transport protein HofQ